MKVFVTKYALTKGIIEKEVRDCENGRVEDKSTNFPVYYHNGEWYSDKNYAIFKAEEMRNKKISSLKKQIEKLEKMKFE